MKKRKRFWIMMMVLCVAALAACNTNDDNRDDYDDEGYVDEGCVDNNHDGYDDDTGMRCGKPHDGGHDGNHNGNADGGTHDNTDGSTNGSDNINCGTPPNDGYFLAVVSDMSDRQEVVVMKAGWSTERIMQMQANKPVCVSVAPSEEPVIMAVLLKCGPANQPCPDPQRPTPILRIKTIPGKDIFYYFGNEVNANLHELPVNPAMFMSAESLGPLYQETNFLIYTEWITGP